jgi:hypothetical protein
MEEFKMITRHLNVLGSLLMAVVMVLMLAAPPVVRADNPAQCACTSAQRAVEEAKKYAGTTIVVNYEDAQIQDGSTFGPK